MFCMQDIKEAGGIWHICGQEPMAVGSGNCQEG